MFLLKFAVFSLLLMCSLLCADGQGNSGRLPCWPPETDTKSSQESQWVFFQTSVYQKQDIFMGMRTLLSTENVQRQRAWIWPLWGLQMYLKPLDKKNGFSKCNDEVKPQFYFIYSACFSFGTNRKCLNIFSGGCSLGRSWRGLSVGSQEKYNHETICLTQVPPNLCVLLLPQKRLSNSVWWPPGKWSINSSFSCMSCKEGVRLSFPEPAPR